MYHAKLRPNCFRYSDIICIVIPAIQYESLLHKLQEKEIAAKVSEDVAATAKVEGGPETSLGGGQGSSGAGGLGGGADLDAYIKNLLSTPAPGQVPEESGKGTSPAGG